ncbi:hypothetical protein AGMMS50262_19960 [Bacteroidia bacterium]|nr:hypothetical protein AGMMS50262_19960 [Bacteroidia bacterium]
MKTRISILFVWLALVSVNLFSQTLKTLPEEEIRQIEAQATLKNEDKPAITRVTNNTHVPNSVTIDKTKAVGEIPFTSGVAANGAMTYNVPIEIYPGIRGFQPQISLAYNHLAGNGVAGIGWNISGLSSIARVPKNMYYDGTTQGVSNTKNDAFVLDGMRLIKSSENVTQINYETEQGQIKVKAVIGSTVSSSGIAKGAFIKYFEVFFPNGTKGTFGYTTNTTTQLSYPLTSLSDLWGNTITYEYTFVNNHYKINKITYNNASVEFLYATRPDTIYTYEAGLNIKEDQYLQTITCKFGITTLRTYTLSYQAEKGTSALSQIACSGKGNTINPLKFYYGEGNTSDVYTSAETRLPEYYEFDDPNEMKVVKGKFNYGAEDDGIIILPNKNPYVKYHRPSSLFQHSQDRFINEYTGDESILLYAGLAEEVAQPTILNFKTEANFIDIFCANLDGKYEEEVIRVNNGVSGSNDRLTFKVYAGNVSSLYHKYTRTFNFSTVITDADGNTSIQPKFYYTGDFNGDGKMEVLAVSCHQPFDRTDRPTKCYLFDLENNIKLYEGADFVYNVDFSTPSNTDKLCIIDYDGDGKSDICLVNNEGTHIYKFNASGSTYTLEKVVTYTGLKKTDFSSSENLFAADFNGDGKTDLLKLSNNRTRAGEYSIFYSIGNGQFEQKTVILDSGNEKPLFQDVNGDGLPDLIRYTTDGFQTYLMTNTGFVDAGYTSFIANSILIPTNINSRNYYHPLVSLKNGKVQRFTFSRNDTKEKLLTGVVSSLGVVNKNYYEMINSYAYYTKKYDAVFPYENFQGGLHIPVFTEQYMNGQRTAYKEFWYENAVIHKQGLGFRGFEKITSFDQQGKETRQTYDPYNFGVLKKDESPFAQTDNVYNVSVASNKITKITLTSSSVYDKLKYTTVNSSYTYDTYGNPKQIVVDYGSGIKDSIKNEYVNNTAESGYLFGFLREQTNKHVRNGNTSSERMYISDYSKGMPLTKVQYVDNNLVSYENFAYNAKGNITEHAIKTYTSTNKLTTKYEYDSYGRITKETDPLGLFVSSIYNSSGQVSTSQNHKNQSTYYSYDGFGRVTSVSYPGELTHIAATPLSKC